MKTNQWIDFDTGDESQSEYHFSYMGKLYCIELTLSVGYGDIWFANLFLEVGEYKQKSIFTIKIPMCESDALPWLKRYLENRMEMLLLELRCGVSSISFEVEDIQASQIPLNEKRKLLDILQGLLFDASPSTV